MVVECSLLSPCVLCGCEIPYIYTSLNQPPDTLNGQLGEPGQSAISFQAVPLSIEKSLSWQSEMMVSCPYSCGDNTIVYDHILSQFIERTTLCSCPFMDYTANNCLLCVWNHLKRPPQSIRYLCRCCLMICNSSVLYRCFSMVKEFHVFV